MMVTMKMFNYNNGQYGLFSIGFIQLIFLYWHAITCMNVAFVTSCGVMSSWIENGTVFAFKHFKKFCLYFKCI